jgi:hypothetical protein
VPKRRDSKLLQVLVRQTRKHRLVYVILSEGRFVPPKAQASQPDHNVHDGAPNGSLPIMTPALCGCNRTYNFTSRSRFCCMMMMMKLTGEQPYDCRGQTERV